MNYQVLIIEDEQDTAEAVQGALELEDIDSDIAIDGIEGLEKFKGGNYDLILLDLKMPKMSGEEVLKSIRKIDPFVDIVIYTNFQVFTDLKSLTNIGIDGFINKGAEADLKELITMIKEKLNPLDENGLDTLINKTANDICDE